jgi:hypothetical protein
MVEFQRVVRPFTSRTSKTTRSLSEHCIHPFVKTLDEVGEEGFNHPS